MRLNLGAASNVKLIMITSPTFNDPNVLPAQVSTLDPSILTSSAIPNSLIVACFKTTSAVKSV